MAIRNLADIAAIEAVPLSERALPESSYEALVSSAKRTPNATALSFFLTGDRLEETHVWTYGELVTDITRAAVMSDQMLAVPLAMLGSSYEQPVPIFQQLARGHPFGRDDVRAIPAVAAQRRGSVGRARDRHQPRDRPVLVEPVWPDVRRRDPKEAGRARDRLSAVALAFG